MFDFEKFYKNNYIEKRLLKLARLFQYEKINPVEFLLKPEDKCLILNPHFDDEVLGCSGLLMKYPDNFNIICLTDGSKGQNRSNAEQIENLANVRKEEFLSVMKQLNINSYDFLEIEDGQLMYNFDKFKALDIADYDYIFAPSYFDNHKDHKAVTVLLQKLLKQRKHKSNLKICFFEVWSALPVPNYYVDITKLIEQKRKLISCYKSQLKFCNLIKAMLSLNTYRGVLVNVGWAEMFTVIDLKTFKKL